jgi:carbamoyltransferase
MPFAASLLWERRHDYIVNANGKDSRAPYMVLGFRTTPRAVNELIAGLHSFDLSCRPQLVEQHFNPAYHAMLKHYERLTGFGGVLNTSFNLHGDPVVCTPRDAIETYIHSDLDVLTIEDYLVWDEARVSRYGKLLEGTDLADGAVRAARARPDDVAVNA